MTLKNIDGSAELTGVSFYKRKSLRFINLLWSKWYKAVQVAYEIFLTNNRSKGDTSNFSSYPDSSELPKPIKPSEDPFVGW